MELSKDAVDQHVLLFLILTYEIIQKLEQENVGYKGDLFIIAILYFADDGLGYYCQIQLRMLCLT